MTTKGILYKQIYFRKKLTNLIWRKTVFLYLYYIWSKILQVIRANPLLISFYIYKRKKNHLTSYKTFFFYMVFIIGSLEVYYIYTRLYKYFYWSYKKRREIESFFMIISIGADVYWVRTNHLFLSDTHPASLIHKYLWGILFIIKIYSILSSAEDFN